MDAVQQSGIRWGQYSFSEPTYLENPFEAFLPSPPSQTFKFSVSGLYAIMVEDPCWTPRPFRPLYFGQSEDIYERPGVGHEKYLNWCTEANGKILYVARAPMFGSAKEQREAAETSLIEQYKPPCNNRLSLDIQRAFSRGLWG